MVFCLAEEDGPKVTETTFKTLQQVGNAAALRNLSGSHGYVLV